jgi:fructose-1-phosphate kinase PfkB-like protein
LIEAGIGQTTELVENSPAVTPQELARYTKTFAANAAKADVIVLSGSLPTDTPRSFYRDLLASAAGSPAMESNGGSARLVFDFRGPELMECLSFGPFLVKPNREELASTVGRSLKDDAALLAAMRELNRAGAKWVLVTNGGARAWLTSLEETWQVGPPEGVKLVNPIGCGDSVAAGIAVGVAEERSIQECVALGFGAAAANLERMECARFPESRARELATRTSWQRVEGALA